jgi:hypothetical protein
MPDDPRRALPSVDAILADLGPRAESHELLVEFARAILAEAREAAAS